MPNRCMPVCHSLLITFAVVSSLAFAAPSQAQALNFVMEKFPPFILDENGRGAGPFPEVVSAVCASMKIQCNMKVLPWRRALAIVDMGAADGIFVFAKTAEREKLFHFSDDVFQTSFAVFVRESAFSYAQPHDLTGFTVATYGPSAVSKEIQDLAKTVPQMKLIMEVDNQSVLRKLRAGRYPEPAAGVMNKELGIELIEQEKLTGVKIAGDFKPVSYAIGFSKKRVSEKRAQEFNDALRALVKQGTVRAIADKSGLKPAS